MPFLREISDKYQIVVAIDFGTTFSGYAYSFTSNKEEIQVNKPWAGPTPGLMQHKTPTCLLLDPRGRFEAFGFEAISKYNDLSEEEASEYYFFDRFKMKLYDNKELNRDTMLPDARGKEYLAVDVFAHSLTFMKKHVLRAIETQSGKIPKADTIRWVLTVPAIWNDNAKQFMREAAYRTGLNSKQLVIALEPEAASLQCRHLPADETSKPTFEPGTAYLVLDAGGGIVDCVVHTVHEDGTIRELSRATGGPWGGTTVDKQFVDLVNRILGEEFMNEFQRRHPNDFIELLHVFEVKKRGTGEDIRVTLPHNLLHFTHNGVSVQQAIESFAARNKNEVRLADNKLVLTSAVVSNLFSDPLNKISDHVNTLLQQPKTKGLKYIFLVGGFNESKRLQESMKDQFGERVTCLVPLEASLAVVKGAVAFGHDPSSIAQRVCRFTYGVEIWPTFKEGIHREDLKTEIEGKYRCKYVFYTWAEAGKNVGYSEIWRGTLVSTYKNQKVMTFKFFKSPNQRVEYTDEPEVEKIGSLTVNMPDSTGDKEREVDLQVLFGGTEIDVVAHHRTSSIEYDTVLSFL